MEITLSFVLLAGSLFGMYLYRRDALHPAFWTNLGFVGYAVAGFYYSAFGYQNATFLNLAGFDAEGRRGWFVMALLIAAIGLIVFNLGFKLGDRHSGPLKKSSVKEALPAPVLVFGKVSAVALILLGLAYYFYFADRVAGGVMPMIGQVGAYPHLVAAAGLSALPFHFVYGGALLWLLTWIQDRRLNWLSLAFVPVAALVILSTGRIAYANAYLFSALLFFVYVTRGYAGWKTFGSSLVVLLPINVGYYFFREYTSYAYIGKPEQFPLFADPVPNFTSTPSIFGNLSPVMEKMEYVFRALIGGGNVPDLQQIILIVHGLIEKRLQLTYGTTFFDWIINLAGSRVGEPDAAPLSVGYRILNAYFPEKNGGPTPGIIGETILNFGFLAPLAIFCIAYCMTRIYAVINNSRSLLIQLLYCIFLVSIWALLIKVDSSLLDGYLWMIVPISLCWVSLVIMSKVVTPRDPTVDPYPE
ncbi:hypothetical protein PSQ90_07670 [Devosia rhodophyticola]|uniref:Oligosaccharide repeat unit polymerase n=1 Tax=Devosia rhodophyticola TaxID=3026423 RepID=A0ABY7Z1L1_9HYPH|nr:hypothetical protein [Devosia rhodophyticola]WDR07287.1 hypothetical protein PSQ90_07670 [Devosia rhodophyticola]